MRWIHEPCARNAGASRPTIRSASCRPNGGVGLSLFGTRAGLAVIWTPVRARGAHGSLVAGVTKIQHGRSVRYPQRGRSRPTAEPGRNETSVADARRLRHLRLLLITGSSIPGDHGSRRTGVFGE